MATAEGLGAEKLATYPPVMIAPYARRFAMPARYQLALLPHFTDLAKLDKWLQSRFGGRLKSQKPPRSYRS